uniref:uncharacterized protein LOC120326649 n=1 Tax=Styela clava TaxID=7725 RepID=UPI00193A999F|nr:uncharacterized protein LOC120326649 [Styela clava]
MDDTFHVGRKLLFHRHGVDDSIGTYATDYLLSAISFIMAGIMTYLIWRHKNNDDKRVKSSCGYEYASISQYWAPCKWPRPVMTSVTLSTYATLGFQSCYSLMTVLGGLPHQYLHQVEPYTSWEDSWTWLIVWRCGAVMVVPTICAFFTLIEQICQQESFLPLPNWARKVYYGVKTLLCMTAVVWNFVRLTDDTNPYDVTTLYIVFMGCFVIQSVWMTLIVCRSAIVGCKKRLIKSRKVSGDRGTQAQNDAACTEAKDCVFRWDLCLQCLCPLLILGGGTFSYILTPMCSQAEDPHGLHGCPLPNNFNHNAVMHMIHVMAVMSLTLGEVLAIKRRERLYKAEINNNINLEKALDDSGTSGALIV